MDKALHRSLRDRMLAGICGGIAEYFGWSATRVRVAWVLLALCGGSGVLLYLLLWLVMPSAD